MQPGNLYLALQVMEQSAQSLGVQGVAVVLACQYNTVMTGQSDLLPHFRVVGRYERLPQPEVRGIGDSGTNYLAVAWSKVAEMISTLADSGTTRREKPVGELGYQGGVIRHSGPWTYFAAFSGGSEAQDVQIAQAGMSVLLKS